MLKELHWKRGLLRLWAVATLLWIVGTLWSVVVPHYFADVPLTPSATEIQRNVQNQLDCLGHDDATDTDKPWLRRKCPATPPVQDPRVDITIQPANDGSLTITPGDGARIEGVPRSVSAKEIADKLHRKFAEEDSRTLYETAGRDAVLVLAPPFVVLLMGFACASVLRAIPGHKRESNLMDKRP
ncbi:hypothetical protein M3I54_42620 [Paraburkholderia sp. CNPSo 3274]|uniref:hypothetical protein n=1 Tax=Paraburkholderia sp. CNPSo 3274 TaxID=2940932 RepID=UPI0020B81BB3|nr:hypothetical protein [Paraburkholderia sp. CNPSo 3274]MCP3713459.1 hypothetical protein [Paraburkholderia sp. CNPSo 3274]